MRALGFIIALVGCNWEDFDKLSEQTHVRSTYKPNIGSRNYATSILGVTTTTSGGQLGVVSDDTPDFSTLDYGSDGDANVGPLDVKLGAHSIAILTDPPIFATDGMGKIAIVERSQTGGNISLVFGSPTAPVGLQFAATLAVPDAVVFTGADIVVAAGNTLYTVQMQPMPIACMGNDNLNMPLSVAALASDGTNLWVWSKGGALFSFPITALAPCNGGMLPAPGNTFASTGFMPGAGARIHLVGTTYAILAAHAGSSRMGQVFVVNLTTMTAVGTPLSVDGLKSSTIATFDGRVFLVLGVPDRAVDGVVAGEVELREFDAATGTLSAAPALLLSDAQPESGQLFGRSVTTMKFNGQTILVVSGNSEVFAYYKTPLYDALP